MDYQVASSLATTGRFDVGPDYPWGFGLAPGLTGERYAVFGPGESVAAAPLVKAAIWLEPTRWYEVLPVQAHASHYLQGSLENCLGNVPQHDPAPHARRMFVAILFNPLMTALTVAVFWSIVELLTGSRAVAGMTSFLFALGSLAWPYSGTFFSEPLATLFALLSFRMLLHAESIEVGSVGRERIPDSSSKRSNSGLTLAGAGASLGVAVLVHVSAILFVPFFFVLASGSIVPRLNGSSTTRMIAFSLGLAPALLSLALFNYVRFGDAFQTGRSVLPATAAAFRYGTLTSPWPGAWGLLMSPGKGLLLYCPAVLLGLLGWRAMHRYASRISWVLMGAAVARILFIGCRSDWHGGFSLGPRYLIMSLPFLVLPAAFVFQSALVEKCLSRSILFLVATFLCAAQQFGFTIGEVFSHLHTVKLISAAHGVNLLEGGQIYWFWRLSPLFHFLDGRRGPYFLSAIPVSNATLWFLGCLVVAVITALCFGPLLSSVRTVSRSCVPSVGARISGKVGTHNDFVN